MLKCNQNKEILKMNLIEAYQEVVSKYWDYDKNLGIKPEDFSHASSKKVWWRCPVCNGSWETTIATKTRGRGCPYCSGNKVLPGYNDLLTKRPDIAKLWDYEKNGDLKPTDVTQYASNNVWWKCDKGHSYLQKIASKTSQNQRCPYCTGRRVLKGFNDFASQHPDLLKEWDYELNNLQPDEVTKGSSKKVHWICKTCGRKWIEYFSQLVTPC